MNSIFNLNITDTDIKLLEDSARELFDAGFKCVITSVDKESREVKLRDLEGFPRLFDFESTLTYFEGAMTMQRLLIERNKL